MTIRQGIIATLTAATLAATSGCGPNEQKSKAVDSDSWALRMAYSHGVADFDCNAKRRGGRSAARGDCVGGRVASAVLEAWQ